MSTLGPTLKQSRLLFFRAGQTSQELSIWPYKYAETFWPVFAHSEPNFDAAQAGSAGAATGGSSVAQLPDGSYPAVMTYGSVPPSDNGFIGSVVGLMQGVYAYAGAQ